MNKAVLKKTILSSTGILSYRWRNLCPGLYVFNYHRIGNSNSTDFDSNVFSCTAENFSRHLKIIKSRFEIINMEKLVDIIENKSTIEQPFALITFDDGYIDNYELAYPILKKMHIPATFFIPTSYIGNNFIPWWDEIAWMIKKTAINSIKLPDWEAAVTMTKENINNSIRLVLNNIKKSATLSIDEKLHQLRDLLGCACPDDGSISLFMSWDHLREMQKAGMNIGSHTHTHQILSHLTEKEQLSELIQSRKILEKQLGISIDSFAFPVGKANTYTSKTLMLCEQAGYKVAFSFIHGYNPSPSSKCFELLRMPVDGNGSAIDLKCLASFAPKEWRTQEMCKECI